MKNFGLIKFTAFTLAEVLVTLGIIGVVASLTMPTLMENHKKKVLITQFKKTYSTISEAYTQAATELGYFPNCYYYENVPAHHCVEYDQDNECSKYVLDSNNQPIPGGLNGPRESCRPLANAFKKSLKIVKECDGNAYAGGCIPRYNGNDTLVQNQNPNMTADEITKATTGCGGFRQNNILTKSKVYVLADGSIYGTYGVDNYYNLPLFFVDTNGKKGPNKWGHDLFVLALYGGLNKELYVAPGACSTFAEDGGMSARDIISNKEK